MDSVAEIIDETGLSIYETKKSFRELSYCLRVQFFK